MTHIDESLAKGLASRFLTECDESVNQFMDRIERINRQTSTKKGWLSKSAQVEKELRSAAFSTHWVGSNSKPALGFIGIGPEKQKFNTWEEVSLEQGLIFCCPVSGQCVGWRWVRRGRSAACIVCGTPMPL